MFTVHKMEQIRPLIFQQYEGVSSTDICEVKTIVRVVNNNELVRQLWYQKQTVA